MHGHSLVTRKESNLSGRVQRAQRTPPISPPRGMGFLCPQSGQSPLRNPSSSTTISRTSMFPLQTMKGMRRLQGFKKVSAWRSSKGTQMAGGIARLWMVWSHSKAGCPQITWRKRTNIAISLTSLIYTVPAVYMWKKKNKHNCYTKRRFPCAPVCTKGQRSLCWGQTCCVLDRSVGLMCCKQLWGRCSIVKCLFVKLLIILYV